MFGKRESLESILAKTKALFTKAGVKGLQVKAVFAPSAEETHVVVHHVGVAGDREVIQLERDVAVVL